MLGVCGDTFVANCAYCGKSFDQIPDVKPRRTCSDECAHLLGTQNNSGIPKDSPLRVKGERPEPEYPTNTVAGSAERIEIYRQRVERGEQVFHPADNSHVLPSLHRFKQSPKVGVRVITTS